MDTNLSNQPKNEFQLTLSKIAHEIRNPVALISSELQMLAAQYPEILTFEYWDDILGNLEYMINLLKELSDYGNSKKLTLVPTDLRTLLNELASAVRPSCEYLEISLETDIPEILPVLSLDAIKIRQAFLNLLKNAMEAISHKNGVIRIQAVPSNHGAFIYISDNGCGITPEQQKELFQPFVTHKPGGTGLGLSITREIIEAHGGTLELYHTSSKGTIFRVFLG